MTTRTHIFIDYWNFQLNWNERANDARCDWLALPWCLLRAAERCTRSSDLSYEGAHIYASVDPQNENLVNWLESFLDRQPGFTVRTSRLVRRQRPVRCPACGLETEACSACGEPFSQSSTKGLTTRLVCDVMSLCGSGACHIPVIVSSDTELTPLLAHLVERGIKVIHAGWREASLDLSREAWASIDLDLLITELVRT